MLNPHVSDLLVTATSVVINRGEAAACQHDYSAARRFFLAGAYMKLVLANDYEEVGDAASAFGCLLCAASCFWRAGETNEARQRFEALLQSHPSQSATINKTVEQLELDHPPCVVVTEAGSDPSSSCRSEHDW